MKKILYILFILLVSCTKELDINDFSEDFSHYQSELKIEALILPSDEIQAIVRIDRTVLINENTLFNCVDEDGDWNAETDDLGSDGIDSNDPDKGKLIEADEDGTEGNGIPDCGEPNVDEYDEYLPNLHVSNCNVLMTYYNEDGNDFSCEFEYNESASEFTTNYNSKGHGFTTFDDMESVSYGAYIPSDNCGNILWDDFNGEYTIEIDCLDFDDVGKITSTAPVSLPRPVVFYEYTEDNFESIKNCEDYDCLQSHALTSDTLFFSHGNFDARIHYSSLLETSYYQLFQYLLHKDSSTENDFVLLHEHPNQATDVEGIYGNTCVMHEQIVSKIFDVDEDDIPESDISKYEVYTFDQNFTNYYFFDMLDLRDPVRTNLRDENGNPIMGTFGAFTGNSVFLRVVGCYQYESEEACLNTDEGVCHWYPQGESGICWGPVE